MPILKRYGRRKDTPDARDRLFRARAVRGVVLPPAISLAAFAGPIKNQGDEGSCTAESGSSYIEWGCRAYLKQAPILSAQDLYANELIADGDFPNDYGSQPRTTCQVLTKQGVCPESLYPFVSGQILAPTPAQAAAALPYKWAGYHSVAGSAAAVACLGNPLRPWPVLFAFDVYESFESQAVADSGIYSPKSGESMVGGHQMVALGYDVGATPTLRPAGCPPAVLCQNSWDTDWGCKAPLGAGLFSPTRGFVWIAAPVADDPQTDLWMLFPGKLALSVGARATVAPPTFGSPPGTGYQEWDAQGNELAPAGPMLYSTDTPAVATVDALGNVLAIAAGSAIITAGDLGKSLRASTQVMVSA